VPAVGWAPPLGGQAPPPGGLARPGSRRVPLLIGAGVVVLLAVAGVVVLRDDPPDLLWEGEGIDEPEATLEDAEAAVSVLVDDRHGALHDDGRCYFALPEDEDVKDVEDHVRCGPVLFVDGDADEPYLSFPLTASEDGGDLRLEVGDRPVEPEPTALDPGERLERPDGRQPPDGNGGLEPPDPPPAADDLLGAVDMGPTSIGTPPEDAAIGSLNGSYALTALATIDRYGVGDGARRPAEGHQLIAFGVAEGLGEIAVPTSTPTVEVQIDEEEPRDVSDLVGQGTPVVVSAPDDAEAVDLVVTDGSIEQRLSLLDGTPDAGNLQVLTRTNRSQVLNVSHQVRGTASDALGSGPVTGTITVESVHLDWFLRDDPSKRPSSTDAAYLVVVLAYNWSGITPSDGGLSDKAFVLELYGGRRINATNLASDPEGVIVAVEVPADFTTGTLHIRGVDQQPTGITIDFGTNVYSTPISIPAG
jgi:hypothetical protein